MPTYQRDELSFHYQIAGSGEPVLLIMGITASHEVWEVHSSDWSQHFQCVMPDNRGVGQSASPSGDYTTSEMALDLIALLDHLALEQVHVVGCSMGSTIAQQLALLAPQRVKSLVLMCPWARCDPFTVGIFENLVSSYQHLPPADFVRFIQLLIFDKSTWELPATGPEFQEARQQAEEAEAAGQRQSLPGLKGQAAACASITTLSTNSPK